MTDLVPLNQLYEHNEQGAVYYAQLDFFAYDGTPREIAARYGIPFEILVSKTEVWSKERDLKEKHKINVAIELQAEHIETVVARSCELALKALERAEALGIINSVTDAEKLASIASKLHKPLQLIKGQPTDIGLNQTISIDEVLNDLRSLDVLCDYEVQ
jgi:hypothetical protein